MPRRINQLRLDRWAAERATAAAAEWAKPLHKLLDRAKRERWPWTRLRDELEKLELDNATLAASMVDSMHIGMGLGILDGDQRPKRKTRTANA